MSEPRPNPEPFWNHRVVHRVYTYVTASGETQEHWYEIHEAHYDAGQLTSDRPRAITSDGVTPHAETPKDLADVLLKMIRALDKPVLEYDSFDHKTGE